MLKTAIPAALLAALLAGPPALAAPGYSLRAVAIQNDPAPGTSDSFGAFLDVTLTEAGEVAFAVPLASGGFSAGVFVDSGSGPVLRFKDGDAPPIVAFDEYRLFGSYVGLDSSGRLATSSVLVDLEDVEGEPTVVDTAHGLFQDTAGTDSTLVVEGDPAPTPPTGTLDASLVHTNYFGMNAAGDLAFESTVSGGTSQTPGLFVRSAAGAVDLRVANGDPVGAGPDTFTGFDFPDINAAGDVAFVGLLSGSAGQGLFVDEGSGVATLALKGDPAPGTGGAAFDWFFAPAQNDTGDLIFMAQTTGGSALGGLFEASPAIAPVLVEGDVVPGAGPASLLASLPEITSDGSIPMSLGFSSGPVSGGVYLRRSSGQYEPVVLAFEDAPGSGGALFSGFGFLGTNDAGQVAFVATLDDGRSGIFLATPNVAAVPLSPAPLVPALALLLAGTGIATLRATRR